MFFTHYFYDETLRNQRSIINGEKKLLTPEIRCTGRQGIGIVPLFQTTHTRMTSMQREKHPISDNQIEWFRNRELAFLIFSFLDLVKILS